MFQLGLMSNQTLNKQMVANGRHIKLVICNMWIVNTGTKFL